MAIHGNQISEGPVVKEIEQVELDFLKDLEYGLGREHKYIPSRYMYDAKGDVIFQQIMELEEYYPTDCENEILKEQAGEIFKAIKKLPARVVELGAGDGLKTRHLLRHLLSIGHDFVYQPIDISKDAIANLSSSLKAEFPELKVEGVAAEYLEGLSQIRSNTEEKLVLFLGSNIGNFDAEQRLDFLEMLGKAVDPGDHLLMGMDLTKDPRIIELAYDDPHGVTAAFNYNVLARANRELGANFEIEAFKHYCIYDVEQMVVKSYLISQKDQQVTVGLSNNTFDIKQWEPIHIENSYKFDINTVKPLARLAGFEVISNFQDSRKYFLDTLWKK